MFGETKKGKNKTTVSNSIQEKKGPIRCPLEAKENAIP